MKKFIFVGHKQRYQLDKSPNSKFSAVLFDGFRRNNKGNEDPFIWSPSFLYTFCHANIAISINNLNKIDNKNNSVYYIFITKYDGKYAIDTVINANKYIDWSTISYYDYPTLNKKLNETFNDLDAKHILIHHFPKIENNELIQHSFKNLVTIIGDENQSFIPITKSMNGGYEPFMIPPKYEQIITSLIKCSGNSGYYPADDETPRIVRSTYKRQCLQKLKKFVTNNVLKLDDEFKVTSFELMRVENCYRKR